MIHIGPALVNLIAGDKGLVLRYLGRTTGYSRQQLTVWCGSAWPQEGLQALPSAGTGLCRKYTGAMCAETDALHDTLSGPPPST